MKIIQKEVIALLKKLELPYPDFLSLEFDLTIILFQGKRKLFKLAFAFAELARKC
jgi:hypothetical protein